jgi:hypothetical protein
MGTILPPKDFIPFFTHPIIFLKPVYVDNVNLNTCPIFELRVTDLFCRWYASTVMFGYYFNPTVYSTIMTLTDVRNIINATIWLPQGE